MDRIDQKHIVQDLLKNLSRHLLGGLDNGHIPEAWDGIELRQYLADTAQTRFAVKMDSRRKKAYQNALTINPNL